MKETHNFDNERLLLNNLLGKAVTLFSCVKITVLYHGFYMLLL